MKIVFLDRATIDASVVFKTPSFEHVWVEYDNTPPEYLIERLKEADIAITNKVVIDSHALQRLPQLKYIAIAATGIDAVDVAACQKNNITVTNVTGYATQSVAEHTVMLMLMLTKQAKPYMAAIQRGEWQQSEQFCLLLDNPISTLEGKTIGLVGTGKIAQKVASIAQAFDMEVLFYSPSGRANIGTYRTTSLDTLLEKADYLSIHCPLNEQTHKLIGLDQIQKMKATAYLLNTARGGIVDIDAIVEALERNMIKGAGLDVLPNEPPLPDDRITHKFSHQNLLVTPHTAWASQKAMQNLADILIKNIELFYKNENLHNLAAN